MPSDDARDGPGALPAEAYPDPVMEYGIADGVPTVRNTDGTFRSEFGAIPAGTPVTDGLARVGIPPVETDEEVASRVVDGEPFELRAAGDGDADPDAGPSGRYRATVIPASAESGSAGGHIVFTGAGATPAGDELGLDHVASVVSHDLRNPLEVAKTRLRAGRETGDEEHFEHVARAHDRMERIIEDVLTLARGEDTIDPSEEVDLTAVAEAAWESVDADGATLAVDAPLPTAVVDADRTERVFENLFRNAVEHGSTSSRTRSDDAVEHGSTSSRTGPGDAAEHGSTSPRSRTHDDAAEHGSRDARSPVDEGSAGNGSPTVRVGPLESASTDGFYVADDGPGIPASEREAVLEPGYSTHEHGTGLGLAIVDGIADAHGWTLRITESEGGGARIEVRDL